MLWKIPQNSVIFTNVIDLAFCEIPKIIVQENKRFDLSEPFSNIILRSEFCCEFEQSCDAKSCTIPQIQLVIA